MTRIHFAYKKREVCDPNFDVAARVKAQIFTGVWYIRNERK
jgi:hypothetical protein